MAERTGRDNHLVDGCDEECEADGTVLFVVKELDDILAALRLLVRACEKRGLHDSAHALELGLEVVLRRRNYILNVSTPSGAGRPYDVFPCENCFITYPTAFLVSWIEYIIKYETRNTVDTTSSGVGCSEDTPTGMACSSSLLCKRTCSLYFGVRLRIDDLVDGVLYPLGAPYVSGPKGCPPDISSPIPSSKNGFIATSRGLLGECDEVDCLYRTVGYVLRFLRLRVDFYKRHGETSGCVESDTALAESLMKLLYARRHFGFDMDCVGDAEVDACRLSLSEVLHSYDYNQLIETFEARFPFSTSGAHVYSVSSSPK